MIVLLHGAPAWGAVERYVEAIARGLGEDAVLVHTGSEHFEALPIRTIALAPAPAPLVAAQLVRLLRRLRPAVVHVTDVWPPALVAARAARVPRLLLTHHTPELPRNDNVVGRVWWRAGWAARPEVIYTSETDRERDGRTRLRTHVVELGIDLDRFASGNPSLPQDGPLVGNVARLAPQKDQRTLIEAARLVLEHRPEVRFAIVGEGELRADLEAHARALGISDRVLFTGAREDVPDVLASLDCFAFPSLFEGLCLAVIEAQAAGVPVVATPVGGIRETVVDGETGLLVPLRDAAALAEKIEWVLGHPTAAGRLAEEARRRVRARFSERRMVERTLELYSPQGA